METEKADSQTNSTVNEASQVYNDYMKKLHEWNVQMKFHRWMQYHSLMMQNIAYYANANRTNTSQATAPLQTNSNSQQNVNGNQFSNVHRTFQEFEIPSVLRRAMAEIIDFCILFFLKTLCLLLVVYYMGVNLHLNVSSDDLFGVKIIKMLAEDNFDSVESLEKYLKDEYSEDQLDSLENHLMYIMVVTFLYRLLTCVYEWLFIWLLGSTPGKDFVGIKVVSCRISTFRNSHVAVVTPGSPVDIYSAWTRALIKNLMISFLIPAFLSAFFYPHNRTSYDLLSNTIVVKKQRHQRIR